MGWYMQGTIQCQECQNLPVIHAVYVQITGIPPQSNMMIFM